MAYLQSCDKVSFGKDKAKRMVKGIGGKGKEMRAYHCDKCFKWHLTSQTYTKPLYNFEKNYDL